MVFGTFDTLHPGHLKLIKQAAKFGPVFVSLTPDHLVRALKKQNSTWNWQRRRSELLRIKCVSEVMPSDAQLNTYSILKKIRPTYIVLGHDQIALLRPIKDALRRLGLTSTIIIGEKYRRDLYASSYLNGVSHSILRHKYDQ
jgi:cytidyltransferase-like protein